MSVSFHQTSNAGSFDAAGFIARASLNGGIILPYIGWIGHRNIGDDIVFDILCNLIRSQVQQRGPAELQFFAGIGANGHGRIEWSHADGAILGGGSTIDPFYIDKLVPGLARNLPIFCFASGYQNDLERTAHETDRIRLLRGARYGSVRGQATRNELTAIIGSTDLAAVVDGGLLAPVFYNPFALTPEGAGFVAQCAEAKRPIIALNVLMLDYAIAMAVDLIERLKHRYAFVLVPFDDDTLAAAHAIRAAVAPDCMARIEENFTDYSRLLAAYKYAAAAINMKLHANVLCAAVGTPSVGLGGGRKMAEFFASIDALHLRALAFEVNELVERIEQHPDEQAGAAARADRFLAKTLVDHHRALAAFLSHPTLAAKLARMHEAGTLRITGLQGIDHGYIVIAPDAADEAGLLMQAGGAMAGLGPATFGPS